MLGESQTLERPSTANRPAWMRTGKHKPAQSAQPYHSTFRRVPEYMFTRRIVGLTGYHGAGKDEAARQLAPLGYRRVSFADPVREGVLRLNPLLPLADGFGGRLRLADALKHRGGWDKLKWECPEVRELLQKYGTEAGRDIHGEDCWVRVWSTKVDSIMENVIVTDLHFANEACAIRQRGGIVLFVDRPGCAPVNGHVSNKVLPHDDVVRNDCDIETFRERLLDTIDRIFARKRDAANSN